MFLFFFSACAPAYVSEEPVYTERARPNSPNNSNIWIDGDYVYNRHAHTFSRNDGRWVKPRTGHTYRQGNWQKNNNGHYWKKGEWK